MRRTNIKGLNRGTLKTLDITKSLRVSYGTVSKYKPRSMYIKIGTWAWVKEGKESSNFTSLRKSLDKKIRQTINNTIDRNNFNHNRTIVDLVWPDNDKSFNYNANTFIGLEITLFQYNNYLLDSTNIRKEIIKTVDGVSIFFDKNETFDFTKTKIKVS